MRGVVFALVAAGFAAAGVFHGAALALPSIAEPSPAWRHAVFIVVNLAFAALTAQQIWSHGAYALETLRHGGHVDLALALVLVAMPVLLLMLALDARHPREARDVYDARRGRRV